ncbi:MAG: hypothetical protein ACT4QC_00215 [Planctomycetaceae bacterium]
MDQFPVGSQRNSPTSGWFAGLLALLVAGAGCGESPHPAKPRSSGNRGDSAKQPPRDPPRPRRTTSVPPADEPAAKAPPQPVYRSSDDRPRYNDERLKVVGIERYESPHLRLYTDIGADLAQPLPPLMDAAFAAWEEYFGPLPPDREGALFQMTGQVMAAQGPFREAGLLPEDLPAFPHGRNRGRRFWMNDQVEDYYRRHLMLHEGTHCYMTAVPNALSRHVWYMEGMAELFGTHRFDAQGQPQFRVIPDDREAFRGLGRIRLVNDEVKAGRLRTVQQVTALTANEYLQNEAYAWSWALCAFLDGHPRYRERFGALSREAARDGLSEPWDRRYEADRDDLEEEWLLFASHLCHGFDLERAAIDFRAGVGLAEGASARAEIAADRGWQSSGVHVEQGKSYQVTARGRFIIANAGRDAAPSGASGAPASAANDGDRLNRPWECEPQGISFRYYDGRPLGMLIGMIRAAPRPAQPPHTTTLDVIPLGREATFVAPCAGTLYLRLNDYWNELADNAGTVDLQLQPATAAE